MAAPRADGAARLAFAPLCAGDFAFDPARAAKVLAKVVNAWRRAGWLGEGEANAGVQLRLVEAEPQAVAPLLPEGLAGLEVRAGWLDEQRDCALLGVGCAKRVARPGESRQNARLHRCLGLREAAEAQLGAGAMAEVGAAHVVNLEGSSRLTTAGMARHVVLVRGPNMNAKHEDVCEDAARGEELLEKSYEALFSAARRLCRPPPAQSPRQAKKRSRAQSVDRPLRQQAITAMFKPTAPAPAPPALPATTRSLLEINPIGLGTLPLGVLYPDNRRLGAAEAEQLVHRALDLGVELFDTADTYGQDGRDLHYVERLLARALASYPGPPARRARVVVATKTGMARIGPTSRDWRQGPSAPDRVREAVLASRAALGAPIALWQWHHVPSDRHKLCAALREVRRLVTQGHVLQVGLCNCTVEDIKAAQEILPIASVQNEWSPWQRAAERPLEASRAKRRMTGVLPYCQAHGIAFLAYGALGGLRARDGRRSLRSDFPRLAREAESRGVTPQALVLAFLRKKWPCANPIPGARRVEHVQDCQSARELSWSLEPSDLAAIERAMDAGASG